MKCTVSTLLSFRSYLRQMVSEHNEQTYWVSYRNWPPVRQSICVDCLNLREPIYFLIVSRTVPLSHSLCGFYTCIHCAMIWAIYIKPNIIVPLYRFSLNRSRNNPMDSDIVIIICRDWFREYLVEERSCLVILLLSSEVRSTETKVCYINKLGVCELPVSYVVN